MRPASTPARSDAPATATATARPSPCPCPSTSARGANDRRCVERAHAGGVRNELVWVRVEEQYGNAR